MIYAHHCKKKRIREDGEKWERHTERLRLRSVTFFVGLIAHTHTYTYMHTPPLPHLQPCDPWPPSYAHMGRGTSTAEIFLTLFLNSELGIQVDLLTGPFFSSRKR